MQNIELPSMPALHRSLLEWALLTTAVVILQELDLRLPIQSMIGSKLLNNVETSDLILLYNLVLLQLHCKQSFGLISEKQ